MAPLEPQKQTRLSRIPDMKKKKKGTKREKKERGKYRD